MDRADTPVIAMPFLCHGPLQHQRGQLRALGCESWQAPAAAAPMSSVASRVALAQALGANGVVLFNTTTNPANSFVAQVKDALALEPCHHTVGIDVVAVGYNLATTFTSSAATTISQNPHLLKFRYCLAQPAGGKRTSRSVQQPVVGRPHSQSRRTTPGARRRFADSGALSGVKEHLLGLGIDIVDVQYPEKGNYVLTATCRNCGTTLNMHSGAGKSNFAMQTLVVRVGSHACPLVFFAERRAEKHVKICTRSIMGNSKLDALPTPSAIAVGLSDSEARHFLETSQLSSF